MRLALFVVILTGAPGLALAGSDTGADTAPSWTVDVGAADILAPAFPGGKTSRNAALPSVSATYKDLVFTSFQDGIVVNILRWNGLTAGPVMTFEPSRSYSDDRLALRGLRDVPFTIAVGGFLNYDFGIYASAKGEVSKSLNGNNGLVADASFTLNAPPQLGNTLFLTAGPDFQWYDGNYSRAYFGVSALNARQSIYAAFEPRSPEIFDLLDMARDFQIGIDRIALLPGLSRRTAIRLGRSVSSVQCQSSHVQAIIR